MKTKLTQYIQNLKDHLTMDPASEKDVIHELETHVEDSCQELQNSGLSEDDALEKCLTQLGSAKIVAHQIYEANNQGTWRQALLAALPHLIFAIIFALKWWIDINTLPVMFVVIHGIAIYGWYHGKPYWLFPWLGYSLFPIVAAGVSLLYLPEAWAWITLSLYIPFVLLLLSLITIKILKRDWSYSLLMLLPAAAFIGWLLAAGQKPGFPNLKITFMYGFAPWTSLTFLVLAISVALFIRLRQRWLRVTTLTTSGIIVSIVIILASNQLGPASFISLILLILSFLLVPAFVERKIRRNEPA